MTKFNKRNLIPFIIFIFLCMLIYSKFAIINVNAQTINYTNSIYSTALYNYYERSNNSTNSPTLKGTYQFSNYNTTNTLNLEGKKYALLHWPEFRYLSSSSLYTPYSYINNFEVDNDFKDMVTSYSTIYANVVLHFRLYYDIRNNNYWNPYREIYNNTFGGSTVHESGSGSTHGGGGVSFDSETSGDHTISGEEKSYILSFFNQDLNLYNLAWGFTSNDTGTFADIYAYYSGSVTLSLPLSPYYDSPSFESIFKLHLPFEQLVVPEENNRTMTATEIMDYFGYIPVSETSYNNSYFEFVNFEVSNSHESLLISDYYAEDSCLSLGNCGSSYSTEDYSILGVIRKIWNSIIAIGQGILNLPNTIATGLASFFTPPEGYLQEKFQYNFNLLRNQLGFLFTPFELIGEILSKYQDLNNSSGIIHIPNISEPFYNRVIIPEQDWNLRSIFETGSLNTIYNLYLNLVDVFLVIFLVNMFLKKFYSVFNGEENKE